MIARGVHSTGPTSLSASSSSSVEITDRVVVDTFNVACLIVLLSVCIFKLHTGSRKRRIIDKRRQRVDIIDTEHFVHTVGNCIQHFRISANVRLPATFIIGIQNYIPGSALVVLRAIIVPS